MNKKFLLILTLVFGFSLALIGCSHLEEEAVDTSLDQEEVEQPATTTNETKEPEPTAEIDAEIQKIDADIGAILTTGFESEALSDQELGL